MPDDPAPSGAANMTAAMLDRLIRHRDIVETGTDGWRLKTRT
ncbi:ATP-binding protein [Roseicyclus mahoneyensis]|nr:ATP-binding protein [Roseicyclus mahoneyensis]